MASFPMSGSTEFMCDTSGIAQQPLRTGMAPYVGQNTGLIAGAYPQQIHGTRVQLQQSAKKQSTNQQNMLCELCSISCSSLATFNEHLAGQKHRKKAAARALVEPTVTAVAGAAAACNVKLNVPATSMKVPKQSSPVIFCDLCNVSCCGPLVFAGHVQGTKHQKALRLHSQPIKQTVSTSGVKSNIPSSQGTPNETNVNPPFLGEDRVTTLTNESGVVIGYHCNLCDCTLTDPSGRVAHLKGKRHKLSYKHQVDSSIYVEMKPSSRTLRMQELKEKKRIGREDHWRKMDVIAGRFCGDGMWFCPPQPPPPAWGLPNRQFYHNTIDDKYIFTKREEVRLAKTEIDKIYAMTISCEKALKLVSDEIDREDKLKLPHPVNDTTEVEIKKQDDIEDGLKLPQPIDDTAEGEIKKQDDNETGLKTDQAEDQPTVQEDGANRAIRGVMRVGRLATGIFLHGDYSFDLVVLCKDKPIWTLLERATTLFKELLLVVEPGHEYDVQLYEDGCIRVILGTEPKLQCTISLTSPTVRHVPGEEGEGELTPDPEDMLPKEKCLESLALLRRSKWFQVRCGRLNHSGAILRVLRDLCRRDARWAVLSDWAQELIVEKCICYAGFDRGPAEILRTIFECIGSGLLTSDGPGLYDPCEKDPVDVAGNLTAQQREDITAAAQHALRLVVYRQMHTVVDVKQFIKHPFQNINKRGASTNQDEAQAQEKRPKEDFP